MCSSPDVLPPPFPLVPRCASFLPLFPHRVATIAAITAVAPRVLSLGLRAHPRASSATHPASSSSVTRARSVNTFIRIKRDEHSGGAEAAAAASLLSQEQRQWQIAMQAAREASRLSTEQAPLPPSGEVRLWAYHLVLSKEFELMVRLTTSSHPRLIPSPHTPALPPRLTTSPPPRLLASSSHHHRPPITTAPHHTMPSALSPR